jgi:hypothetical protein
VQKKLKAWTVMVEGPNGVQPWGFVGPDDWAAAVRSANALDIPEGSRIVAGPQPQGLITLFEGER